MKKKRIIEIDNDQAEMKELKIYEAATNVPSKIKIYDYKKYQEGKVYFLANDNLGDESVIEVKNYRVS